MSAGGYDALALYSGGLDSILACKVVEAQGLRVLALHFVSPFFGKPELLDDWRRTYGLDILAVDLGEDYIRQVVLAPPHGYGKFVNPCVDCHAFMARRAVELLPEHGARFLVSGEVLGQRPMSQRREAMDQVVAAAGGILVRPLCAKHLPPTEAELRGWIDRGRLLDFKGRGRTAQLALAERLGITDIPTPAGGCMLTQEQPAARYLRLMELVARPTAHDFALVGLGRALWSGPYYLAVGRHDTDNRRLRALARPDEVTLDLRDFPSPLAVLRRLDDRPADEAAILDAAALAASYAPKAVAHGGEVVVLAGHGGQTRELRVAPRRQTAMAWREWHWPDLADAKQALKARFPAP